MRRTIHFFSFLDKRQKVGILLDSSCILIASLISMTVLSIEVTHYVIAAVFFIKILFLLLFSTHRSIWRFFGFVDFLNLAKSLLISLSLLMPFFYFQFGLKGVAILALSTWLEISFLVSLRVFFKYKHARTKKTHAEDVTILIGAGSAGEQLVRDTTLPGNLNCKIIAIFDDKKSHLKRTIHGVPILGDISDIAQFSKRLNIKKAILAIPSASPTRRKEIIQICNANDIELKVLPRLEELSSSKVDTTLLRNVKLEDLLDREPIQLNLKEVTTKHTGKVILITGAGGSIGSELCKQVLKLNPKKLVAVDNNEFFLYSLRKELENNFTSESIATAIGDVRDIHSMDNHFKEVRPDIVYHAAAYKHVPIMEEYPFDAIETNIRGTKNIADLADKYNVDKFILISTDKAVNPTNVMGTTKRIAEMYCQKLNSTSNVIFRCVRFGNVLGSNGSVIPLFKEQIQNGGPVTVTHPDITRYFMTIPEACLLVLQTSSLESNGDIFILDMGKPVKIVDLAQSMISLSGLTLQRDILIEYTGLRPGEKLYEELLADDEKTSATNYTKIRAANSITLDQDILHLIEDLISTKRETLASDIRLKLKRIVPEYNFNL